MLGNCATGRVRMVIAPKITSRIAITIATIGRRMKKLDIQTPPTVRTFYGAVNELSKSVGAADELPSSAEARVVLVNRIIRLTNTTPALRAAPPQLRRGICPPTHFDIFFTPCPHAPTVYWISRSD